ncbi:transglycosylase SLT domain-containing protein [Thiomicrorhabdus indica]|uniref:transglycosylase SLT domain-containing protein n=1 Tax=Thiomicrorhabdus indica TaxID=2267253 RepID=UPI00102DD24D|nr:transglycosylase SLT domain-containing protein [Thiomicrorhabdus indica]
MTSLPVFANHFVEIAQHYGHHPLVLYGIAQQESTNPSTGKPWPWTANFDGKGVYYNSKQQAIAEVYKALKRGQRNIDVGIMQVSLRYHSEKFKNLNEAFDPKNNIRVAAEILSQFDGDPLFLQIAKYHCPSKKCRKRAYRYAQKVIARLKP